MNWNLEQNYPANSNVNVNIPYDKPWIIEMDMKNLHPGAGFKRYVYSNKPYGIDLLLGAKDLGLRLSNRIIWFTSALIGGVCNPYPPAQPDHVGQTLNGDYRKGNHLMKIEYSLIANSLGLCNFYWDNQIIGKWNTYLEKLPAPLTSLKIGWFDNTNTFDSATFRYFVGNY